MEQNQKNEQVVTIDLMRILIALWHRAWVIVLGAVLAAALGFSYTTFFITPSYSSSILLYVNNSSLSLGGATISISASDLSVSKSLVSTYSELLKSRTTLEMVIEEADLDYSYGQVAGMISSGTANDTAIMKVTVTCGDPYEAANIANAITKVLPIRMSEIMEGTSMVVVDSAIPRMGKVAPNITRNTAMAMIIGMLIPAAIIALLTILDDAIHDEEYILQNYEYPVLAKIPNLKKRDSKKHAYYYSKHRSNGGQKQ